MINTELGEIEMKAEDASKVRTLSRENNTVLLACTEEAAALYQSIENSKPKVKLCGESKVFECVNPKSNINVLEFGVDDFALTITNYGERKESYRTGLLFDSDEKRGNGWKPSSTVLLYGKTGSGKLRVRIICTSQKNSISSSYCVKDKKDLWMVEDVFIPLLISWGFKFKLKKLFDQVFSSPW